MSDTIKFFSALYGSAQVGGIEVAFTPVDSGAPTQCRHIDVGDFDTIEDVSSDIALTGSNQYFIPNIIKESAKGRSSDSDIKSATCVFADFDGDGDLQRASKIWKDLDISPPWVVITGRTPHIRGHAYWPLDGEMANMTAFREVQQQLAAVLGGDTTVQNPSRLMRMPGSIAYPKKDGRIQETTEIQHRDQNQQTFSIIELRKTLNSAKPHDYGSGDNRASDNVVPINGSKLNLGLSKPLDVKSAWEQALASDSWHNNVIKMVASWVHRGLADFEIHQLTQQMTLPGYTAEDTAKEVTKAIDSARLKWGVKEPDSVLADPETDGRQEQNAPVPASMFIGEPPARQWVLDNWIPRGTVTALFGDGGVGKTLIAQQLANCLALGRGFMNTHVRPANVLFIACEDDTEELHRRQFDINNWLNNPTGPDNLYLWPRVGFDNILASFKEGEHAAEAFYDLIKAEIERIQTPDKDTVIFLDTAADMYGGNENSRREVNMFLKTYLGSLCVQYKATIIVLAHPSVAGMASGSGMSGSTAWNNGVRGRFYLTKADGGLDEERVLSRKKSNYSSAGDDESINLIWEAGVLTQVDQASGGTISRIERNTCERETIMSIDKYWEDGMPLKGAKGPGGRSHKLTVALPRELAKKGHSRKVIAAVMRELIDDELIVLDKKNTGTTTIRGYRLTDAGMARLGKKT